MINYSLKDNGIFYVTFSGSVSVEDISKFLSEFEKLSNLPKDLLALYDLREVDLVLKVSDLTAISELTIKITAPYKTVKTAFLTDKPNLTAYSILFTEELVSEKTMRKVFSTEAAALNWLK
jgi:hypothetical protein